MTPLAEALASQPGVLTALNADLAAPSHAYLFVGPTGSGKSAAARAFAAELLAGGAADPESARRRALADPSPHPDFEWVQPPGNQHLVSEIRERVIAAVPYRPFEGERRVFVIAAADALAEESQNALLLTLEEPPPYVHLILTSADPASILPTVRSRCRTITFAAPGEAALVTRLGDSAPATSEDERRAAARLSGGDGGVASYLLSDSGRRLRLAAERCSAPTRPPGEQPWLEMIELAAEAGERSGQAVAEKAEARAEEAADEKIAARIRRDGEEAAKRAVRRDRTRILALGLRLWASRLRDVEAALAGSKHLLGCDRAEEVSSLAGKIPPGSAAAAAGLVAEAQRRLRVNVSEELALEALVHRVARELG